jgi:hypothetical protein
MEPMTASTFICRALAILVAIGLAMGWGTRPHDIEIAAYAGAIGYLLIAFVPRGWKASIQGRIFAISAALLATASTIYLCVVMDLSAYPKNIDVAIVRLILLAVGLVIVFGAAEHVEPAAQ